MGTVDKIKALIDEVYEDLQEGEIKAVDIYDQYPGVPHNTMKYRLDKLVKGGKLQRRKGSDGQWIYREVPNV